MPVCEYCGRPEFNRKCSVCGELGPEGFKYCPNCGEMFLEPLEEDDIDDRVLCLDDNCIGIIGPDGRCTECGQPGPGR